MSNPKEVKYALEVFHIEVLPTLNGFDLSFYGQRTDDGPRYIVRMKMEWYFMRYIAELLHKAVRARRESVEEAARALKGEA